MKQKLEIKRRKHERHVPYKRRGCDPDRSEGQVEADRALANDGTTVLGDADGAPVIPRSAIEGKTTIARIERPKSIPKVFREMNRGK